MVNDFSKKMISYKLQQYILTSNSLYNIWLLRDTFHIHKMSSKFLPTFKIIMEELFIWPL